MGAIITVSDVMEMHNCAGKKTIIVTSMAADEVVPAQYVLTENYMLPHEKLILASVAPQDMVRVEYNQHSHWSGYDGEYVANLFVADDRKAMCPCGTLVLTDGYFLYCPNPSCGLTAFAKIKRLAQSAFFTSRQDTDPRQWAHGGDNEFNPHPLSFDILLNPKFWSTETRSIEKILLRPSTGPISLANFLVPDMFRELIEQAATPIRYDNSFYAGVNEFYGMMDQVIFRRDYDSTIQNHFLKTFIWALGIEAVSQDIIELLMVAEQSLGQIEDVLLPYAHYLSNPRAMSQDLGVYDFVADAITNEFYHRRHEFFDIFSAYSPAENIVDIFQRFDTKLQIPER